MRTLLNYSFITIIAFLLSACFNSSETSIKPLKRSAISVYGLLPEGETIVTLAKDADGNGYVDDVEFAHPLYMSTFQKHYTLSDIKSDVLYAIRFEQNGFAPITHDLAAGSQNIDIETFIPQYRTTLQLPKSSDTSPLIFELIQTPQGFEANSGIKNAETSESYFRIEIPRTSLKYDYHSITAIFDTQRDPRTEGIQYDSNQTYGFYDGKQINYTLLDENNQTIELTTTPVETFGNLPEQPVYAFEGHWKHSYETTPQSRRSLMVARTIDLSSRFTVCVEASIEEGGESKPLDEMQIDAYGPAHLRALLGNGESFEGYGNVLEYSFSAKTRYVPGAIQPFTPKTSQKSGCDYEATLAFTNPYTRALHVHADTNGSYSLQDGYIWIHTDDYSFYSYAYLDASGDATMFVEPNTEYQLHYKNTQATIGANQNEISLTYLDTPPLIYHYFTKEAEALFETLNVIALDDNPLLDINVTQDAFHLDYNHLEQNNEYHFWRFDINATMVGSNVFGIKVQDNHNSVMSQTELYIPNYPPEILLVTLTDKYGEIFDLNDTLYDTDYNLTITTAPDKNGHSVKTWGSFKSNSPYNDSKSISFSSGIRTLYLNADDGYETVRNSHVLSIEPYVLISGANNLYPRVSYMGENNSYYFQVSDPYGDLLHYQWFINNTLVSEDVNLSYIFSQLGDYNLTCIVSNRYKSVSKEAKISVYPSPITITATNISNETVYIGTNKTYYIQNNNPYGRPLHYKWFIDNVLVSEEETFTYNFELQGGHSLIGSVSDGFTENGSVGFIHIVPKPIVIEDHNILNSNIAFQDSKTFFVDAINPYNDPLHYQWYVNDVLVSEDEAYTHTFNQIGDTSIACKVSNQYSVVTKVATFSVDYAAPEIIDLSQLPPELLYGTYEFYVVADDMYDENLTYEWLINNNVVSTDTNFTQHFEQDEDIILTCNVSSSYKTTTVSRATHVYYPKPVITKALENTQKAGPVTFNVTAYHELPYTLSYEWLLDGTGVASSQTYDYTPQDNAEHNLTCKVSNLYKSVYTSATIGTTLTPKNLVIDTLPGNHVVIYDDDMNITHDYIADDNGTVSHATTKSHINFAVVANDNTVLSEDMFFKLVARDHPCLYYASALPVNFNATAPHLRTIPNFYIDNTFDLDSDGYFDKAEIFQFGLETFDINHNDKIELGEIYFSTDGGDKNLFAIDARINMHYPVETYRFQENRFMDLVNAYVYRANLGFFPQYQNEQLSCGVNQSYVDITVTGMPDELYPQENFVQTNPSFLPRNSLELPSDEIISVTSNSVSSEPATDYNITYRTYSFTKNDKDLTNFGLILSNASMYYIVDINTTLTPNLSIAYDDLMDMNTVDISPLDSYDYLDSLFFHNGQSVLSSLSSYRQRASISQFYTATNNQYSNYLLAYATSTIGDDFEYLYNLDYGYSLTQQTSFSTLANSVFATKEENYPSEESLTPFFKRRYEELYAVDFSDTTEEVDLVRYQYQLTDGYTAYASVQVNYPNEYVENKRFIGFIRMDNNESFSSLLPQALQEEAERFFAITNTTASRPYFNEKLQLIDLKNFGPNDRDNIIKLMEEKEVETLQRRESTFYNYDQEYDYYGN